MFNLDFKIEGVKCSIRYKYIHIRITNEVRVDHFARTVNYEYGIYSFFCYFTFMF